MGLTGDELLRIAHANRGQMFTILDYRPVAPPDTRTRLQKLYKSKPESENKWVQVDIGYIMRSSYSTGFEGNTMVGGYDFEFFNPDTGKIYTRVIRDNEMDKPTFIELKETLPRPSAPPMGGSRLNKKTRRAKGRRGYSVRRKLRNLTSRRR